jgi:hypothetical protein
MHNPTLIACDELHRQSSGLRTEEHRTRVWMFHTVKRSEVQLTMGQEEPQNVL